jgi:hypothetical protein
VHNILYPFYKWMTNQLWWTFFFCIWVFAKLNRGMLWLSFVETLQWWSSLEPILFMEWACLLLFKLLINSLTIIFTMGIYYNIIVLLWTCSRIKWYWISMCVAPIVKFKVCCGCKSTLIIPIKFNRVFLWKSQLLEKSSKLNNLCYSFFKCHILIFNTGNNNNML